MSSLGKRTLCFTLFACACLSRTGPGSKGGTCLGVTIVVSHSRCLANFGIPYLHLGVLLSCHPRSRTVRKIPYQPTNLPGPLQLSAELHPPKKCVKEATDRPTRSGECGT